MARVSELSELVVSAYLPALLLWGFTHAPKDAAMYLKELLEKKVSDTEILGLCGGKQCVEVGTICEEDICLVYYRPVIEDKVRKVKIRLRILEILLQEYGMRYIKLLELASRIKQGW